MLLKSNYKTFEFLDFGRPKSKQIETNRNKSKQIETINNNKYTK